LTTNFDISSANQVRTFKERLSDIHQTSLAGGLFNIVLFLILIVPIFLLFIAETIYKALTGQLNQPVDLSRQKEFLIDIPTIKIKTVDFYSDRYYNKLKAKYNYSDDDLRDIDNVCFIESLPDNDFFSDKLFTYTMIDFSNGLILQEVDFDRTPCTSKIVYLDLTSGKTEILKELKYLYDLSFDKTSDKELNILLRFPGDKQVLTVERKDN
jgi:hypothetical protein